MQVDRLLWHSLDRFHFKLLVETFARLGKLAVIGAETRDDIVEINDTVLWHELIHRFKWSKLLKFECEHRLSDPSRLLDVSALCAIHSWGTRLNNDSLSCSWHLKDGQNGETS